ncbi:hypothetical protein [Sphingomonas adhaesiva]|uniref:hypothetical protein n=1 Tax=Sphingomonas adhaesiva TaxID=28212 RepID=UPI002FFC7293
MRALLLLLPLAACSAQPDAPAANTAAVSSIQLPAETAALPATPAGELLTARCTACHSGRPHHPPAAAGCRQMAGNGHQDARGVQGTDRAGGGQGAGGGIAGGAGGTLIRRPGSRPG